ncbi:MAG: hypothetical protein PWQ18_14 [Clostridia bacterium]|nr:hypothetical protein [Clostridia bacterium]
MRIEVDVLTCLPGGLQAGLKTLSLPAGSTLADLVRAVGIKEEYCQYIKVLRAGCDVAPPWEGYNLRDGEAFAIYMMLNGG